MPRVTTEIKDHIAHVTLTRADKMNGVDIEMAEALVAAGQALLTDQSIRAVVLAGEGRACTELMRAMDHKVAIKTGAEVSSCSYCRIR